MRPWATAITLIVIVLLAAGYTGYGIGQNHPRHYNICVVKLTGNGYLTVPGCTAVTK